jgi:hypothetical protein
MELSRAIRNLLPTIAYYPTFIFDFPDRIYLTERNSSPKNKFYRQLFQDILDYDGSGYTIHESIISRLHKPEIDSFWDQWFPQFAGTSEEAKVKQVIARAEQAVTKVVFSEWKEVFGENAGNKRISIEMHYEKGKAVKDEDGTERDARIHDAYIRFRVVDGANPYAIEDRSLGRSEELTI